MKLDDVTLANALYDALENGDVKGFREQFTADAVVWHNFDETDQSVDEAIAFLGGMLESGCHLSYPNRRYIAVPDGFVLQHDSCMTSPDGSVMKTPTMQRVFVSEGKVYRIEEYFDTTKMAAAMSAG